MHALLNIRFVLLAASGTAALCISTLAVAQAAPAEAPSAPAANRAELDEIVVTAQRRSENLQDVPISVTAADAATLSEARVINIENITALSPSITFRTTNNPSSSSNIQIRGIGTTGNARSFEGAVGVFVDGVYRTRSGQALQNFLDIDNLQVLRGPQGTLFGKNTSAGALLITSNAPSTEALGGTYEGAYGNYNYYLLRGAINVPISDKLAVRFAAMQTDRKGYYKDLNGGTHNFTRDRAVKGQILFKPTDDISFRLIADYARSTGDCCHGSVDVVNGPTQPLIDSLSLANGLKPPSHNPDDYQSTLYPRATPMDVKDYGGTLISDFDIGAGTLHSVTALRRYSLNQLQDADFSGADILSLNEQFKSKFFSQELVYNGKLEGGVNADYVIGAFFSDEKLSMGRNSRWGTQAQFYWDTLLAASGVPRGTAIASPTSEGVEVMGGTAKSYAAFTHWDFKVGDNFNIIAGARYSREQKSGFFYNQNVGRGPRDPLALLGVQPGIPYDQDRTDNAVSGTVGVQYRPADGVMLYATYNRGFKAGGVNIDSNAAGTPGSAILGSKPVLGSPQYKPETVNAFELGSKIDWLDHRARTNISLFYNKLKDLQVAQFLGLQFSIVNAPKAETYGAEIEQTFKLSDVFTLNGAATWLPKADFGTSTLLGAPLSGRRFSTAPKFAANVALNAEQPVNDSLALTGRVQMQYSSTVFTNPANNLTQPGYALVNGNIGIKSLNHGWTIEAYVQNLTDKRYVTVHFNTPLQTGDNNGYLGAPRTFGATLRGTF